MKKNFNIYDYVISHFISKDERRSSITEAYQTEDYVYGTDAYIVIRTPKQYCLKKYRSMHNNDPDKPKPPNFESVFNTEDFPMEKEKLTTGELLPVIDKIKIDTRSYTECENCAGKGRVYCTCCDNENDCKDCDGEGEVENTKSAVLCRSVYFEDDSGEYIRYIKIGNNHYNPAKLELVMLAMLILGEVECTYSEIENKKGLFTIGPVEIICMVARV